jgi:hypothetical protein
MVNYEKKILHTYKQIANGIKFFRNFTAQCYNAQSALHFYTMLYSPVGDVASPARRSSVAKNL